MFVIQICFIIHVVSSPGITKSLNIKLCILIHLNCASKRASVRASVRACDYIFALDTFNIYVISLILSY